MQTRYPLTALPSALIEAGYAAPAYRDCYHAAIDARIPAKRGGNGRWSFDLDDLPAIADRLGLLSSHAA